MATRDFAAVETSLTPKETISPNRQALLATIQAISTNQFDALPDLFTEDAELHIYGFAQLDGSWTGRAAVIEAIACNFDKITDQRPVLESMIEQGDTIAVRVNETGVLKKGECSYEVQAVIWYTFTDGRIRKIEEFVHIVPAL